MAVKSPMEEIVDLEQEMNEVVAEINAHISSPSTRSVKFMLSTPGSLTVKRQDSKYTNVPHVGGEEFSILRAYRGKRGGTIFVFKPVDAASYIEMEMSEAQADASLTGFSNYMSDIGWLLKQRKQKATEQLALEHERLKNSSKKEMYGDLGFGSW